MSSEILSVLEYMEKEKGIPRTDMIATITNALKTAAQKGVSSGQELKIEINPRNGQLHDASDLSIITLPGGRALADPSGKGCNREATNAASLTACHHCQAIGFMGKIVMPPAATRNLQC